jgi:hypothetical protein
VDDLERGDADDLIAQPGGRPVEVGQLLGGDQRGHSRLAATGQERDHVVGAEGGELVDGDRRGRDRSSGPRVIQPIARGADQILHDQRAELRRESAVPGRVQAEQHDLGAPERLAQVDRRRVPALG